MRVGTLEGSPEKMATFNGTDQGTRDFLLEREPLENLLSRDGCPPDLLDLAVVG